MDAEESGLAKLVSLARARSPEARRALIRDIVDLFMDRADARSGPALAHVDDILTASVFNADDTTRRELADRFATSATVPAELARRLMADPIAIAEPLLIHENGVDEADLERVAREGGVEHGRRLADRPRLCTAVCDALIARRDDDTLVALAKNDTANLSRPSLEAMVDASENLEPLRRPLADRADMPADLLHEMYFLVEADQRAAILERTASLSEDAAKAAFDAARDRLYRLMDARPPDYADALKFLEARLVRGAVRPQLLLQTLEEGRRTRFFVCLAHITGMSFEAAKRVAENPESAPFATACRAADIPTAIFVALALFRPTRSARRDTDPDMLQQVYNEVPIEVAQSVMRFWRVRECVDKQAATRAA